MKKITIIIIFLLRFSYPEADSNSTEILIPLYEGTKLFKDYRVNQTIFNTVKWVTASQLIVVVPLGLFGQDESGYGTILAALTTLTIATPVSMITGYFKGKKYNKLHANGKFKGTKLKLFGYEISQSASNGQTTDAQNVTVSNYSFYLLWRSNKNNPYIDEIKVGMEELEWSSNETGLWYDFAIENRVDLQVLSVFRRKIFSPFVGLGVGYSYGYERGFVSNNSTFNYSIPTVNDNNFNTPFIHLMAGLKINLFDFFFIRITSDYEPFGAYYFIRKYSDYKYLGNFKSSISLGTYTF